MSRKNWMNILKMSINIINFRGSNTVMKQYATVENLSQFVDELPFVIAHTGIKHHSGSFHRPLRERWLEGEPAVVNGYKEITEIAREGKKALINKDWKELAYLMNKNHEIQDNLADSGQQNRYMIKVAKENGALAAKLAGAGGGGTIISLTFEPERVKKALIAAGADEFVEVDPRVTRVGKFLRETSLDETPQILNVIKGDMSFIGPRASLAIALTTYQDDEIDKMKVRPGITGYTQAYFRNALSNREKRLKDAWYANNVSFILDIKIIFKTIVTIITRKSLYTNDESKQDENISIGV